MQRGVQCRIGGATCNIAHWGVVEEARKMGEGLSGVKLARAYNGKGKNDETFLLSPGTKRDLEAH